MSHETDIAWMAGLFEGEGSIIFRAKSAVTLVLGMTDRDVIDQLQKVAGCGSQQIRNRGLKTMYVWECSRKADVTRLLWLMLPYFGERRGLRTMAALERMQKGRKQGTAEVCGRGHLKVGDNLYVDPKRGWAQCKECRRVNARVRYQKEALNA